MNQMALDEKTDDSLVSDHSLLRRIRSGEEDAALRLYVRYAQRLQALASNQTSNQLASRFDPEDVVQSVFRTFFRRASMGLYDVPPGEELWGLFLVLGLNKIRALGAFHRAQKRNAANTLGSNALDHEPQHSHDENSLAVLTMVIDELLEQLPEKHQVIVRLRIDGHAINEISQQTGRSKRTVERVLQDFRTTLSRLIDDEQNGKNSDGAQP